MTTCKECRFFRPNIGDDGKPSPDAFGAGQCRRNTPVWNEYCTGWPAVNETHWCGEWRAIRDVTDSGEWRAIREVMDLQDETT